MPTSVQGPLDQVHRKMLRVSGEGDPKKLADRRYQVARLVARALELTGAPKQDAAAQMGYTDASVISRWISGQERPLFDRLLEVEGPAMTFEDAWTLALAERNSRMEIITQISMRRSA